MMGDSEAKLKLKPPTPGTIMKEQIIIAKRNWYTWLAQFPQFIY